VESTQDARDGSLRLLDVNLRVWGWHVIVWRQGLGFPSLAWRQALGEPVEPVRCPAGLCWLRMTTGLAADDPLPALLELPLHAAATLRDLPRQGAATAARRSRTSRPHTGVGVPSRSETSA
jgi:hypothetical protein